MGNSVSSACPTLAIRPNELNLPSMAIGALAGADTLHRTVTSVGSASETYTASVQGVSGVDVVVSPSSFTIAPGAAQNYSVAFTRTTAPFGTYTSGFITLTGDKGHVVRIPVVVNPVKIQVPTEAPGTGTTGSLTYNAKAGFNGTLTRSILGLQAATKFDLHVNGDPACGFDTAHPDASVANGTATLSQFTTPADARQIRFQTFQSDASATIHDLDMFVYRTVGTTTALLTSGGPDANEVVNGTSTASLTAGATWKVYVLGCGVDAGGGDFTLFAWALTGTPSDAFTAQPAASTPVTVGQVVPETFSWSGLASGNRYLGRVQYGDGSPNVIGTTLLTVSTR
jgi:hypothetical protein